MVLAWFTALLITVTASGVNWAILIYQDLWVFSNWWLLWFTLRVPSYFRKPSHSGSLETLRNK